VEVDCPATEEPALGPLVFEELRDLAERCELRFRSRSRFIVPLSNSGSAFGHGQTRAGVDVRVAG
jgi:hypothetical protein